MKLNDSNISKTVFVTGANGEIGKAFVKYVLKETDLKLICIVRDTFLFLNDEMFINCFLSRITVISPDVFLDGLVFPSEQDVLVHLAFARSNKESREIAASVEYSKHIFRVAKQIGIKHIIYVSSQAVYGMYPGIRSELTPVSPISIYGMAKYASELLLEDIYDSNDDDYVILRLDNVITSQKLVKSLCKDAIENHKIILRGGQQLFSYIDLDDVSTAILTCVDKKLSNRIYNVGPNEMRVCLIDIAETIFKIAMKHGNLIKIELHEEPIELWAGMNTSAFISETGWHPMFDLDEMIERVYCHVLRKRL